MKSYPAYAACAIWFLTSSLLPSFAAPKSASPREAALEVGLAVRDVTPELPIRLAGYAGRKRPADRIDTPLLAQGLALRSSSGERFVVVALDNCEVSRRFMEPVLKELESSTGLRRGAIAVVTSHTHSAPVLEDTLTVMNRMPEADRQSVLKYSRLLKERLVEVVQASLKDLQPAVLEHGLGQAKFAMNRRVYRGDKVVFGDNPDAPVDWDVPVLRIKGTNGAVRAIVFGYACHGTSVRTGDDWYSVSGEYMAYARQHLETAYPGAAAIYLTGMGADSDPSPRGLLVDARRHGLELAGAVAGVLNRPMRPVSGEMRFTHETLALPLVGPPSREQLQNDAASNDLHIQARAKDYLAALDENRPAPDAVTLPVSVLKFGDDLTLVLMGGEVVVDYSRKLKRLMSDRNPWTVAYAYDTPCYIPSARLLKEGGYETETSMIYYGFYGPFEPAIEETIVNGVIRMAQGLE